MNHPPLSPADAPDSRLAMSIRDAARQMGISERTLFSLTKSGEVPHLRIGKRVLYRREALEAWLREREQRGFGDGGSEPVRRGEGGPADQQGPDVLHSGG
jgi:excisionase family DNA binding protein